MDSIDALRTQRCWLMTTCLDVGVTAECRTPVNRTTTNYTHDIDIFQTNIHIQFVSLSLATRNFASLSSSSDARLVGGAMRALANVARQYPHRIVSLASILVRLLER
jgi:hypothetical protein